MLLDCVCRMLISYLKVYGVNFGLTADKLKLHLGHHTVFIRIDAHAQIDAHPPSSSKSRHTKIAEIDDFCTRNA